MECQIRMNWWSRYPLTNIDNRNLQETIMNMVNLKHTRHTYNHAGFESICGNIPVAMWISKITKLYYYVMCMVFIIERKSAEFDLPITSLHAPRRFILGSNTGFLQLLDKLFGCSYERLQFNIGFKCLHQIKNVYLLAK